MHLFRLGTFSVPSLVSFIIGFAMFGAITYLPAFFPSSAASRRRSGVYMRR